jgi:ATP-dependent DNA ligase
MGNRRRSQRAKCATAKLCPNAEGPDFSRYHRDSDFRDAPQVRLDRNDVAKLITTYRAIERGSWKVKAEGKRGGAIDRSALRVASSASRRSRRMPPGFVPPCIPTRAHKPPIGRGWAHEIKHDGYRLQVRRDEEAIRLVYPQRL